MSEMVWRPIETAPKDGTPVIVVAAEMVGEAYYDESNKSWWWANTSCGDYHAEEIHIRFAWPTHWMPLPDAPELPKT